MRYTQYTVPSGPWNFYRRPWTRINSKKHFSSELSRVLEKISENPSPDGAREPNRQRSAWGISDMCRRNLQNSWHSRRSVRGRKGETLYGTSRALFAFSGVFFFNISFFLSVLNPAVRCFETILDACTPMSAVRMKVLNGSEKPSRVSGNSGRLSPSVVFTNTFSHTGYTSGHT